MYKRASNVLLEGHYKRNQPLTSCHVSCLKAVTVKIRIGTTRWKFRIFTNFDYSRIKYASDPTI